MKKFEVIVTEDTSLIVSVTASSPEEAEEKVEKALVQDGKIPLGRFQVDDRSISAVTDKRSGWGQPFDLDAVLDAEAVGDNHGSC